MTSAACHVIIALAHVPDWLVEVHRAVLPCLAITIRNLLFVSCSSVPDRAARVFYFHTEGHHVLCVQTFPARNDLLSAVQT